MSLFSKELIIYIFCVNFAFGRLIPFASISRQLESEQNVIFYPTLAQYIMYPSATLQNKRRIFHFARCRMSHFGLILDVTQNFVSNILRPSPSISVYSRPFPILLHYSFLLFYSSPSLSVTSASVLYFSFHLSYPFSFPYQDPTRPQ